MTREYLARIEVLQAARCGASTTSLTFSLGSKTLTTDTGKDYALNSDNLVLYLGSDETQYMYGQVTAYNQGTGSLTVNITGGSGAGTHTDWILRQTNVLRYSQAGFRSLPTDAPANTYWDARLSNPGQIKRSMYADGATRGRAQIGNAVLELINSDNALDDLIAYGFDGWELRLMRGESSAPYTQFNTQSPPLGIYFLGVMEQPVFNDTAASRTITVSARDGLHLYDKPLQAIKYAGDNALPAGVEGTADDLKGRPKVVSCGICRNVSPVLVNTSTLIYQLSFDGFRTGYSLTVYDARTVLTAGADYVSQADMEATAPAAGQYRVWPAGGMFRLGSAPVGQITCDVTNPYEASGPTTGNGVYQVLRYLLFVANLDGASGALGLAANSDCGVYITDEINLLDALDMVAESINGYYNATKFGVFYVSQLRAPSGTPDLEIDETSVLSIARRVTSDASRGIPVWRVNLSYRKNWTVQNNAELSGASAVDIAFTAQEYRTVQWEDATVKHLYPLAPELNVVTLIDTEAAAQAEADRLGTLHGVQREMYQISVPLDDDTINVDLNNVVQLTHSAYGLSGGKLFAVLGYQIDAKTETVSMTLWG